MTDRSADPIAGRVAPSSQREEAQKVTSNLKGDHRQIAHYLVERCGDFIFDHEREDFIAEFLRAAALADPPVAYVRMAPPGYTAVAERLQKYEEIFAWLLGLEGEFPEEPEPLAGKYRRRFWWRSELRERILKAQADPPVGDVSPCVCRVDDGLVQEWVSKARAVAKSKGFIVAVGDVERRASEGKD